MTISVGAWLLLAAAALVVGLSKTSIAGLGSLAVAAFALVLPAKESTAAVLLLLICGDVVALLIYHRQADWTQLKRLLPAVVPGIVIGAIFLRIVSDRVLLVSVAACLFVAVGLQVGLRLRERRSAAVVAVGPALPLERPAAVLPDHAAAGREQAVTADPEPVAEVPPGSSAPGLASYLPAILAGLAAGFTTMVANAAGAVRSLYLLAIKADKARFVATGAWFYFLVNLTKLPFSLGLGLLHWHTVLILAGLVPVVLLGTWLGRRFLRRLTQRSFERLTIAASALSAIVLLLKGLI
jgi:uncharacterized membrane protein YfcA